MNDKHKKIYEIINIRTTLICLIATIGTLMGAYGTIITFMGDHVQWLIDIHIAYKIIFIILISATITLLKIVFSFVKKISVVLDENSELNQKNQELLSNLENKKMFIEEHSDSICYILEEATNRKRYQEVISIGTHLSLPLWYTGKYTLRIRIGHMVEFASAQVGDKKTQALALIEDIGWTNIRIKNYENGKDYITRGLQIAKEIGDSYLIAQATRNLADIHLLNIGQISSLIDKKNEAQLCIDNLCEAEKFVNQMTDSDKKDELLGNIYYTYSKYYFEIGNTSDALIYVDKSFDLYKLHNLNEKQIKLFVLKGKILLNDDLNSAISVFQEGLRLSQKHNVNVHIASNALQLCKIYIRNNAIHQALQMLKLASEIVSVINDPVVLAEYEYCVKELEGKN